MLSENIRARHCYDVTLTKDRNGWRATFLHQSHVLYPWVGQVLHWWPTPWRAVQEAAWRTMNTPLAQVLLGQRGERRRKALGAADVKLAPRLARGALEGRHED